MKKPALLLFINLIVTSASYAQFAGGSGTEEDPYQIETIEQLQAIADTLYLDKHFIQIANIDASETKNWNEGKGFTPIGDDVVHFTGSYDGGGHEIDGLYINRSEEDYVGLFGYADVNEITQVGIIGSYVRGGSNVGILIGRNDGIIIDSYAIGNVTGIDDVGGLVGINYDGSISSSYAKGGMTGERWRVGGLVGDNSGIIDSSHAMGTVSGSLYVGGLIGSNWGAVRKSYAESNVEGEQNVGGLIGIDWPWPGNTVENSYATGNVTGKNYVGGLVGSIEPSLIGKTDSSNKGGIRDVFASDSVAGELGVIRNTFATGRVSGEHGVSGLVGHRSTIDIIFLWNYWDMENTDQGNGLGGIPENCMQVTGLTTDQMTGQNAYIHMYKLDFDQTWQLAEGYPVLAWQEPEDAVNQPEVPIVRIDTTKRDFGMVGTDSSGTEEVIIRNTGNKVLNGEAFLAGSDTGAFVIAGGLSSFSLEADISRTVAITFQPESPDRYEAELHVVHDAPNRSDTLIISLVGEGKEPTDATSEPDLPDELALHQNYPNPFNPVTVIPFSVPEQSHVRLEVYDILGRRVTVLADRTFETGRHETSWDASQVSSGLYIVRMAVTTEDGQQSRYNRTMSLVK